MVPILMYHQVARPAPAAYAHYTVTPVVFARQMRVLAACGYRSVSLECLGRTRAAGLPIPKRTVVITFDDGFQDAIRHAVPVLAKYGFTATFFVVAGLIGRTSEWTRARRAIEMPLADLGALREIDRAGFTIGSHTMTHRRIADLTEDEGRRELHESRQRLEDWLGRTVRDLAYPYGSASESVRRLAADCGYLRACSTIEGLSPQTDDPLMLRRVHIAGGDSLGDFTCRLRTGRPLGALLQRVRETMKVSDFVR